MTNQQCFHSLDIDITLFDAIQKEQNSIGYYALPDQSVSEIQSYAKRITQNTIVVVGIGGSTLGSYAVYDFLRYSKPFHKTIHFLESTDPVLLRSHLDSLDLSDTLFLIISKSGTTIETISIFKYILSLIEFKREHFIIISGKNSPLHQLSHDKEIDFFEIPDDIGGRFSVLSIVGLLPLALIGVDIGRLLNGAKRIKEAFFNQETIYRDLINKASFYASNKNQYNINCLFSYAEAFRGFNAWYVQLWGESLGKEQKRSSRNIGLTPIGLIGPTDQHSFLQLIAQGERDKSVTFLKIKDFKSTLSIPDISIEHLEQLDYLNGVDFASLINKQADSIIESLKNKHAIPLDIIEIEEINEEAIGELFYYFELLTSLTAQRLDVNAYDQPGVEDGKKILRHFFD